MMEKAGEISGNLLMDSTEMITALIIARNLDSEGIMPTFLKDGKPESVKKKLTRIGGAKSMAKIREKLMTTKDNRKPEGSRN